MARIALRLRRTVEDPADVTRARELGRRLADDGAAVGEALRHLRDETLQDRGREPRHEEVPRSGQKLDSPSGRRVQASEWPRAQPAPQLRKESG